MTRPAVVNGPYRQRADGPFGVPATAESKQPMTRSIFAALAAFVFAACFVEEPVGDDDDTSASSSSSSGDDVEFRSYTWRNMTPAPGTDPDECEWWNPFCSAKTCPSCDSYTADHGHNCTVCSGSDCNCEIGGPPWTDPRNGITYVNHWYPSVGL